MKNPKEHHEQTRKELWANAWVGTSNASNCINPHTATRYADEALKAFDERFPVPSDKAEE